LALDIQLNFAFIIASKIICPLNRTNKIALQ